MREIVEVKTPITFYLNVPGESRARKIDLSPGQPCEIASDVWGALLARKDSPLAAYLATGVVVHVNADRANNVASGDARALEPTIASSQAAAEAYRVMKERLKDEPEQDLVEQVAREAALEAAAKAQREIDPHEPKKPRVRREHGRAYDEDEVFPIGQGG